MLQTAVLICGFLHLVASQTTIVDQCNNVRAPLPINTYIEGCQRSPCQLPQLQDVVLHIVFKAPETSRTMTTLCSVYFFGPLGITYDLGEEAQTCNYLTNTYCPVLKEEVVEYTLRMYIEPFFPVGTSVTLEFRIVDENRDPIVCIRTGVAIIPPVSSLSGSNGTMNIL